MTDLRKAAEMALEAMERRNSVNYEYKVYLQDAIDVLRQALAQPEQNPVAWMRDDGTLLFADGNVFTVGQAFYTAPPSKPWVSLTDEQIGNFDLPNKPTVKQFVRFVEAALRSKNT